MTRAMAPTKAADNKKVAVVTGSNRGIGLQIVKNLCQQLDSSYDVLLTSRNEQKGQEAVRQINDTIKNAKATVKFHQLDIDNRQSIENLRNDLQKTYGGLNILVQNGAIFLRGSTAPVAEIARTTLKTNYWGVRDLCRVMLPIMREHGRIVILASRLGSLDYVKCTDTRNRLLSDDLKLDDIDKIIQTYIDEAQAISNGQQGQNKIWADHSFDPYGAYAASKVGVIALARVLQREVDNATPNKHILITSCCPGYVDTDMTEHKGEKTVEEGADTPTYLAMLNNNDSGPVKGLFLGEREVIDWATHKVPVVPDKQ